MQQPLPPEDDLTLELQKQEQEIHKMLALLNELFLLASDASLSMEDLKKKSAPMLDKLKKINPTVAKELTALFSSADRKEMEKYFEKEKGQLIGTLSEELKHHQALIQKINREKNLEFPTDS